MEKYSTLLIISRMQIKTILGYDLTQIECTILQKVGEDEEKSKNLPSKVPSKASSVDISGGPGFRAALSLQVFFHCDQHESHQLGDIY